MINFIAVDDIDRILKRVEKTIDKTMISNNINYKIHSFSDYDKEFFKVINKSIPNKVYILDIETPSASGIDVARIIRKNDVNSVIIFITAHEELGSLVLKDQLMFLTFISKFDDFESKLKQAIIKSLEILDQKKVIRFKDYNTLYTIPIKDILYITRDTYERKCFIKTDYTTYKTGKTLAELKEMTSGYFKQSHRACLVNMDRVRKINRGTNQIEFDTGEIINLLSNNYKKELLEC